MGGRYIIQLQAGEWIIQWFVWATTKGGCVRIWGLRIGLRPINNQRYAVGSTTGKMYLGHRGTTPYRAKWGRTGE